MSDYGVKVGQVYVPADGSVNELTVINVDYQRQEATVFSAGEKILRQIDFFKLAMVRYSLKE